MQNKVKPKIVLSPIEYMVDAIQFALSSTKIITDTFDRKNIYTYLRDDIPINTLPALSVSRGEAVATNLHDRYEEEIFLHYYLESGYNRVDKQKIIDKVNSAIFYSIRKDDFISHVVNYIISQFPDTGLPQEEINNITHNYICFEWFGTKYKHSAIKLMESEKTASVYVGKISFIYSLYTYMWEKMIGRFGLSYNNPNEIIRNEYNGLNIIL
jgi:hypothetical protein